MRVILGRVLGNNDAQDIAEYAMMLAVILVIVLSVVAAIGTHANTIFSKAASGLSSSATQ